MDKIIEAAVIERKKKKYVFLSLIVLIAIMLAVVAVRSSLTTNIQSSQIITGIVDRGSIENTITASGEILPEFEEVISSPIDANIKKVYLDQGSKVDGSQQILLLDKSATENEYKKQQFQLESKRNEIRKLKLDLNKTFYDVHSNNDIKQLNINSLTASLEDQKRLYKAGGSTKEDVAHAELNLKIANLEKKQLENEIRSKQQTMQLQIREAEIAASIQESDLEAMQKKLQQANIAASRPGVITWVNKNIGALVRSGEVIAKVADLSSFKISGSISDSYADKLKVGMPVIIHLNDSIFRGSVISISPAVQNAIINFDIQLNNKNNVAFRPNMKVDLFLVTATKSNVLRAPNGPAFKGGVIQDIFVIDGFGKAHRREVHTGFSNFDFVEVDGALHPGDKIITSDMSEYKNVNEIIISK